MKYRNLNLVDTAKLLTVAFLTKAAIAGREYVLGMAAKAEITPEHAPSRASEPASTTPDPSPADPRAATQQDIMNYFKNLLANGSARIEAQPPTHFAVQLVCNGVPRYIMLPEHESQHLLAHIMHVAQLGLKVPLQTVGAEQVNADSVEQVVANTAESDFKIFVPIHSDIEMLGAEHLDQQVTGADDQHAQNIAQHISDTVAMVQEFEQQNQQANEAPTDSPVEADTPFGNYSPDEPKTPADSEQPPAQSPTKVDRPAKVNRKQDWKANNRHPHA